MSGIPIPNCEVPVHTEPDRPLYSWLWFAIGGADPYWNSLFLEPNCHYWLAQIKIPDRAVLRLRGGYPHARYASLQS